MSKIIQVIDSRCGLKRKKNSYNNSTNSLIDLSAKRSSLNFSSSALYSALNFEKSGKFSLIVLICPVNLFLAPVTWFSNSPRAFLVSSTILALAVFYKKKIEKYPII